MYSQKDTPITVHCWACSENNPEKQRSSPQNFPIFTVPKDGASAGHVVEAFLDWIEGPSPNSWRDGGP